MFDNYLSLDYHEQLYYCGKHLGRHISPASVHTLDKQSKKYSGKHTLVINKNNLTNNSKKMTNGVINKGHETYVAINATDDHVEAYRAGVNCNPPLKVISHIRGGVGNKTNNVNGAHGLCRNQGGTFYATA